MTAENKSCVDDITANLPNECKNVGQLTGMVSNNTSIFVVKRIQLKAIYQITKYVIEYKLSDLSYKIWYSKDDYINESIN